MTTTTTDCDADPFTAATRPIVIAGDRWSVQWIELRHSDLEQWRRLVALLPDGRVMIAALNAFDSEDAAREAGLKLQRPWASTTRGGHLYVEADCVREVRPGDDVAHAHLRAIEELVRDTAAAAFDPGRPGGIAPNPAEAEDDAPSP